MAAFASASLFHRGLRRLGSRLTSRPWDFARATAWRVAEAADRIVVLAAGKVAETGTPAELLKKENGMFRRMTQLQASSAEWSI